jgi:dipeptidyl aminopeptidase/acylaminoacyl peptidase
MKRPAARSHSIPARISASMAMAALGFYCGVTVAQESITRPVIAEQVSPLEVVHPKADDGYSGLAILRKPPGEGPFPAIVLIHGGLATASLELLTEYVTDYALPSRFLAAGYVVASTTYRSRNEDLQTQTSRDDSIAVVKYLQGLSYVDEESIGIYGCSGGGDLVLAVAAEEPVAAVIAEEPASVMFTGIWNNSSPKSGELYTAFDSLPVFENGRQYYTDELQQLTREKIARIQSPIFIFQGDGEASLPVNDFNAAILIPELRSAGKTLKVKTYAGGQHCFAFGGFFGHIPGVASQALAAFGDAEAFIRQYVAVKPIPMDSGRLASVVIE